MFALILGTKVVEVSESEFPVAEPMQWVICSDVVRAGWFYVNEEFKSSLKTDDEILEEIKNQKILHIKDEASKRITDQYSSVEQRNILMSQEATVIATMNDAIKDIRDKSNTLEGLLDDMSLEQLKDFDATQEKNWS